MIFEANSRWNLSENVYINVGNFFDQCDEILAIGSRFETEVDGPDVESRWAFCFWNDATCQPVIGWEKDAAVFLIGACITRATLKKKKRTCDADDRLLDRRRRFQCRLQQSTSTVSFGRRRSSLAISPSFHRCTPPIFVNGRSLGPTGN